MAIILGMSLNNVELGMFEACVMGIILLYAALSSDTKRTAEVLQIAGIEEICEAD